MKLTGKCKKAFEKWHTEQTPDECFKKPKCSKDYQIGNLVGQIIVPKLPTLSTDDLKTFNVIEVPGKLAELWEKKDEEWKSHLKWFSKKPNEKKATEIFNRNLKWYKANLENIFLEKEIRFIVYDFYGKEFTEDMRKGFDDAIWNCDLSHYVFSSAEVGDITTTVTIKMKYDE